MNYSLSIFHSPFLLELYTKTVTIMLFFNSFSFFFMSYAIIQQGKTLKYYRWLLLLNFFLSYLLDLSLFLIHPVQFFPALVFYFDGILGNLLDPRLSMAFLYIAISLKMLSIACLMSYRFAMSNPGKLQEILNKPKYLLLFVISYHSIGFTPLFDLLVEFEVIRGGLQGYSTHRPLNQDNSLFDLLVVFWAIVEKMAQKNISPWCLKFLKLEFFDRIEFL